MAEGLEQGPGEDVDTEVWQAILAFEKILEAIRSVLAGKTYLSPDMTQSTVEQLGQGRSPVGASPVEALSNRELELFQLTGEGTNP